MIGTHVPRVRLMIKSSPGVAANNSAAVAHRGTADEAMTVMREMMAKLKLTVNETKTRLCRLPDDAFDFLSYTLGRNYDNRTGESDLGPRPSRKTVDGVRRDQDMIERRRWCWMSRSRLGGSTASYVAGPTTSASGQSARRTGNVNSHVRHRVRQWLCGKFKVPGQGKKRYPDKYLHQTLRLHELRRS